MAPGGPVALLGPDPQHSSCLWHLQTAAGSQLELHMEWLLPQCQDRLAVYDSLSPSESQLITSWDPPASSPPQTQTWFWLLLHSCQWFFSSVPVCLYSVTGCSRHERQVSVLSSGQWMAVVWRRGLYYPQNTFLLSAQAWERKSNQTTQRQKKKNPPTPTSNTSGWNSVIFLIFLSDCSATIWLKAVAGIQGTLKTPFYPSYYPPDTNCTWSFTVGRLTRTVHPESSCVLLHLVFCVSGVCVIRYQVRVRAWRCSLKVTSWVRPATTRPVPRESGRSRTGGEVWETWTSPRFCPGSSDGQKEILKK